MKLRIREQTIRLRLTQGEVARLGAGGRVEAALVLGVEPGQRLRYAVQVSDAVGGVAMRYAPGALEVLVPEALAREWVETERVGLEGTQAVGVGERVSVLVEKDFACLRPRAGDEDRDAFPHPRAGDEVC